MSGLIALLDDVAALTRIAATSLDDVASMAPDLIQNVNSRSYGKSRARRFSTNW
jgi:hypothetical protein